MNFVIREYLNDDGSCPYRDWLTTVDISVRARIQARVLRFETGNLGDHKAVGEGVWEARLPFGPGYRLYFGKDGKAIIVLLLAGDKASQRKDIGRAKRYWRRYLEENNHGKTKC
jgi:putative addiction module killer protein